MFKDRIVNAVGAMSGTSLDGVDAAMLTTDGHDIIAFGPTAYCAYSDEQRKTLRAALGKWQGDDISAATELVEDVHAHLLSAFEDVDLFGFHGQTLAHDPQGARTHQCGSGDVLAQVLNKPVVWDFRSADMQMGGEGAPLAPFFHFALAKWIRADGPVVFLNLGGVGNLTWIDPSCARPQDSDALLAFDTGPANAPLNDMMQARLGKDRDESGELAASGLVDRAVVDAFLAGPYFYRMPPKSLDRDSFADVQNRVAHLSDADAAATLSAIVVGSVARGMEHCPVPPAQVLVTGGGRHNQAIMAMLADAMDCPVRPVEEVGLDGDMLEAQAFAYLAVRVAKGLPTSCPGTTGVRAAVSGGTISQPPAQVANVS